MWCSSAAATAERWRSERWDSFRLLTPNWMSRLPDRSYAGNDPEGFMTMPEVSASSMPMVRRRRLRPASPCARCNPALFGYRLETSAGTYAARAVVIATGQCDLPHVPAMAAGLPKAIHQVTPSDYRNPGQLPPGGVLVVGASPPACRSPRRSIAPGVP